MMRRCRVLLLAWLPLFGAAGLGAQESLSKLPGYASVQRIQEASRALGAAGRATPVRWEADGSALTFRREGKLWRIDLHDFTIAPADDAAAQPAPEEDAGRVRAEEPAREPVGRAAQSRWVRSPTGQWMARYRDFNVVLEKISGPTTAPGGEQTPAGDEIPAPEMKPVEPEPETRAVTTSGSELFRYGTACWVYGEELFQDTATWWSPDGQKLAFYEIDERHLQNYYLTLANTEIYTTLQIERYPKAGMPNPYVGLLIYDLASGQTTRVDVGGDRQQYVYAVRFTPDGSALLFHRTNRRQDTLEVMAADPATGESRLVVREQQTTWQNNKPLLQFLRDGQHFIWETERAGWKQYELRHLDGRLINPITPSADYPVDALVRVDEDAGLVYYSAYSGDNPLDAHLHRVRLDGSDPVRLTTRARHHSSFHVAPNHDWFVATHESVDAPPVTALFNRRGEEVAVLAAANQDRERELGLTPPELFTFRADDERTILQGILHKPAHFDPARRYPLLINVYGGPSSRGITDQYQPANAFCEFGCLIATIANRGTTERGKAFEAATYLRLGEVDLKDQADGVRYLCQRPYVDATRVGIFGHSYGGYMSALAILKYPDLFQVAVAGAPVTDWRNYDTIYTERYMRTPQENPDGYQEGSCLTHARNLRGRLLLLHGLVDDNVHPANTWQLIDALIRTEQRCDLMVFPRDQHGLHAYANTLRWQYFLEHLHPEPLPGPDPAP